MSNPIVAINWMRHLIVALSGPSFYLFVHILNTYESTVEQASHRNNKWKVISFMCNENKETLESMVSFVAQFSVNVMSNETVTKRICLFIPLLFKIISTRSRDILLLLFCVFFCFVSLFVFGVAVAAAVANVIVVVAVNRNAILLNEAYIGFFQAFDEYRLILKYYEAHCLPL